MEKGFKASSSDLITPIKSVAFSENSPSQKEMSEYSFQPKWGGDVQLWKQGRDIWLCLLQFAAVGFLSWFHLTKKKIIELIVEMSNREAIFDFLIFLNSSIFHQYQWFSFHLQQSVGPGHTFATSLSCKSREKWWVVCVS